MARQLARAADRTQEQGTRHLLPAVAQLLEDEVQEKAEAADMRASEHAPPDIANALRSLAQDVRTAWPEVTPVEQALHAALTRPLAEPDRVGPADEPKEIARWKEAKRYIPELVSYLALLVTLQRILVTPQNKGGLGSLNAIDRDTLSQSFSALGFARQHVGTDPHQATEEIDRARKLLGLPERLCCVDGSGAARSVPG
jgi:hypothetical protein